jgi:hypothetical protein
MLNDFRLELDDVEVAPHDVARKKRCELHGECRRGEQELKKLGPLGFGLAIEGISNCISIRDPIRRFFVPAQNCVQMDFAILGPGLRIVLSHILSGGKHDQMHNLARLLILGALDAQDRRFFLAGHDLVRLICGDADIDAALDRRRADILPEAENRQKQDRGPKCCQFHCQTPVSMIS